MKENESLDLGCLLLNLLKGCSNEKMSESPKDIFTSFTGFNEIRIKKKEILVSFDVCSYSNLFKLDISKRV